MMLVASELEKLLLYTPGRGRITLGDVETMVLAAKQRSLYELTDAISARDRVRALALLQGLLNSSDAGEDAAIGHLYMLARTFRQMLVILEKNVRDSRAIWQALWQGFRMPPFAADDLIRQARRYKSRRELTRALRLVARADLELRSSPPDKRLVLERLVYELASEPKPAAPAWASRAVVVRERRSANSRAHALARFLSSHMEICGREPSGSALHSKMISRSVSLQQTPCCRSQGTHFWSMVSMWFRNPWCKLQSRGAVRTPSPYCRRCADCRISANMRWCSARCSSRPAKPVCAMSCSSLQKCMRVNSINSSSSSLIFSLPRPTHQRQAQCVDRIHQDAVLVVHGAHTHAAGMTPREKSHMSLHK